MPIELRYDEYELGISENRVLKAALLTIERFNLDSHLLRRLRHLRHRLDGVEPWPVRAAVPDFHFSRQNDRYRAALALSRLVLERRSLEYPEQRKAGAAFLFNMNRLFEAFLESALGLALRRFGGTVRAQHRTHLDIDDSLVMKPDITWWQGDRCLAVFDAKYKRVTSEDYPNADAYQMLAYCTRLGLQRGYLVFADLDGTSPSSRIVRNSGVEVVVTSVDLSGSIDQLHESVAALAELAAASAAKRQ